MQKINFSDKYKFNGIFQTPQGPNSHNYFDDMGGGSKGFFEVWNLGQKGFFGVYERRWDIFVKKQGVFGVINLSSAQINNNISTIYWFTACVGVFWLYAKKVGIFLGIQILKLGFFGV